MSGLPLGTPTAAALAAALGVEDSGRRPATVVSSGTTVVYKGRTAASRRIRKKGSTKASLSINLADNRIFLKGLAPSPPDALMDDPVIIVTTSTASCSKPLPEDDPLQVADGVS